MHLEFLNGGEAQRVAQARAAALFGEERLRVVAAVHGVVVQQSGNPRKLIRPNVPSGAAPGVLSTKFDQRRALPAGSRSTSG